MLELRKTLVEGDINHAALNNRPWSVAGHTIDQAFSPDGDNTRDLGKPTTGRWKDLYLAGNLKDDTYSLSIANLKTAYDHSQNNSQAHTDYMLNTGDTSTGNIIILNPAPILVLQDSNSLGAASVGYIEWRDSGGGRAGFLGNNTSGNDDFLWKNEQGGNIGIQTTGGGKVQIFANLDVGDNNITNVGDIALDTISDDTGSANTLSIANLNTAYDHSQDNTQAHTDYLLNNADDITAYRLTMAELVVNTSTLVVNIDSYEDRVGVRTATPAGEFHVKSTSPKGDNISSGTTVTANYSPSRGTLADLVNDVYFTGGDAWNVAGSVNIDTWGSNIIKVDFGSIYAGINKITLNFWDMAGYRIDYSTNDADWYQYGVDSTWGIKYNGQWTRKAHNIFPSISARYIRIYVIEQNTSDGHYSLGEVEVYGDVEEIHGLVMREGNMGMNTDSPLYRVTIGGLNDPNLFKIDAIEDCVGIGAAPVSSRTLLIHGEGVDGKSRVFRVEAQCGSAGTGYNMVGVDATCQLNSSSGTDSGMGLNMFLGHTGASNLSSVQGMKAEFRLGTPSGTKTVTAANLIDFRCVGTGNGHYNMDEFNIFDWHFDNSTNRGNWDITVGRGFYLEDPNQYNSNQDFRPVNWTAIQIDAFSVYTPSTRKGIWLKGDGIGSDIVFGGGGDAKIYYDNAHLIINPAVVGTGSAKIGDSSNHTEIKNDGEINLVGTARVKKEIVVDLGITDVPAADNPDKETLIVGSGTNIETHTLAFNPAANPNDEEVFFEIHMPADVDGSVNVHFHLMWFPDPNWTTGNYKWDMEYIIKNEDGTRTTGSSTIITESVTPDNAIDFIETEFSTTINADAQQVIYCRLSLDASESGADDDGHITFGEIEYTANKFGEAL